MRIKSEDGIQQSSSGISTAEAPGADIELQQHEGRRPSICFCWEVLLLQQ